MDKFNLYQDIATRTGGDIYLGVVGPVRTGKSTFITKFMEALVLPNIQDKHRKNRVVDEMPQSADGKTIMTTQPKFVPDDAVKIMLADNLNLNVRLIDCVGYAVGGAVGYREGEKARLVKTPWSDEEIPFEQAGEIGTDKVINDHSTIGVVVTTDGSFGEIDRADYVAAERKVIAQLKAIGKPFTIVLNSKHPKKKETQELAKSFEAEYGVNVIAQNVLEMETDDIAQILESVLMEFPLKKICVNMPKWMQGLKFENSLIQKIIACITAIACKAQKMGDYKLFENLFENDDNFDKASTTVEFGEGNVVLGVTPKSEVFYRVLSEECGEDIENDFALISFIKNCSVAKREYSKIEQAMREVEATGYGVVTPRDDEMILDKPEVVKRGSRFGVSVRAKAPSLHIVRVDVETEMSPTLGSQEQSEEMARYLLEQFEADPESLWEINMFGKTLGRMVKDGINAKLTGLTQDTQVKMKKTLGRIVNEGKGGVLCVLL